MKVISSLIAVALCSASTLAHSYYFEDGFEGGDTYSSNAQGFSWGGDNSNAIFNSQGMLWKKETGTNSPPLTSFTSENGWTWAIDSNTSWTPRSGSGSNFLNFIYSASDNWAERRFELGAGGPDVWISFWLRVPTNYILPNPNECGSSSMGDKLFALWHDSYTTTQQTGSSFVMGLKPETGGSAGRIARLDMNFAPGCKSTIGDKTPNAPCTNNNWGSITIEKFIVPATDAGKWMHIVIRAKENSATGIEDGLIQMWRKWDGGAYTQIFDRKGIHVNKQGGGWQAGYILGDSGLGHCEQTEWLMDDFIVSDKPLISILADPKAPGNFSVTK